jgi:hypothetical protein
MPYIICKLPGDPIACTCGDTRTDWQGCCLGCGKETGYDGSGTNARLEKTKPRPSKKAGS